MNFYVTTFTHGKAIPCKINDWAHGKMLTIGDIFFHVENIDEIEDLVERICNELRKDYEREGKEVIVSEDGAAPPNEAVGSAGLEE